MPPNRRSRVSSKQEPISHRLAGDQMVFKREDTPVPMFPFAHHDDASRAFDNRSTQGTTRKRSRRSRGRKQKKTKKKRNPKPECVPAYIQKQLLHEEKSALRVPQSFETWATEYLKLNTRTENKQSAYSMFMESGRALFEKKKWGDFPMDIWFKLPASLQWQWRQSAGVARLAVEDGLKDWKVDDRRLIDNFTEMRKYRSFRPYPVHNLGKLSVEVVRRDTWNKIVPDNQLPPIGASIPKIEALPPVGELLKFMGSHGDRPGQRLRPGSPAKRPYEDYHYQELDVLWERKWVVHSMAWANNEEEDEEASSDEASVQDEVLSDEGEETLELQRLFKMKSDLAPVEIMDERQNAANGWQKASQARNADPRSLLATYPMASVTPVMHPGRHLSTLTQVIPMPIYMQPQLVPGMVQDAFSSPHSHGINNSFLNRLSVPSIPPGGQERAFWEVNQQQAARLIAQQAAVSSPAANGQAHPQYNNYTASFNAHTNHDLLSYSSHPAPSAFAQSILSSEPFNSRGSQPGQPSYPSTHYPQPSESHQFFNQFLQSKAQEMKEARAMEEQAYQSSHSASNLRAPPGGGQPYNGFSAPPTRPPSVSPQKRKANGEPADSPSIKRVHSVDQMNWSPMRQPDFKMNTPQRVPVTDLQTAHPNQKPYVQVPQPPGWTTPKASIAVALQHRMPSQASISSSPLTATPSPKKQRGEGWQIADSDDDGYSSRLVPPSTQSRPGDRDERSPTDKFVSYIEDIFEAEDSIPAEPPTAAELESYDYFSKLTTDWSRPNLNVKSISKFVKLVDNIARPTKRLRLDALSHSPSPGRSEELSNVEFHQLSRVIKILERTVVLGEDVDPFDGPVVKLSGGSAAAASTAGTGKSPAKGKKKRDKSPAEGRKTRSKSRTPGEPEESEEQAGEIDTRKMEHSLRVAKESLLAADACLALLGADHLPKQLYSEELITSCLNVVKNQLTRIIYPFLEAGNELQDHVSKAILRIIKQSDPYAKTQRGAVSEIFQALVSILPRIDTLVRRADFTMSDSITIQAVFIAVSPFFVTDPAAGKTSIITSTLGGATALRGLTLSALSLIRSLFANNEEQRAWIVEEILTSLIKIPDLKHKGGQFRLRDGKSIHTVSALLLQLVQTSPHTLRHECASIAKQRRFAPPPPQDVLLSDSERAEIALYSKGLESSHRVAKTIVVFLTQRSGKTKAAKSSNEAEYRAILDNLISDLLTVLYLPEWPAAGLLLGVVTRLFVASLDDVKTNASVDNSATRSTALDHLGIIAARLRTVSLRSNISDLKLPPVLHPLDDGLKTEDNEKINLILAAHDEISAYLSKKSLEDSSNASAQDLSGAIWGHELAHALMALESKITQLEEAGQQPSEKSFLRDAFRKLKGAMLDVWKEVQVDVFSVSTDSDIVRADKVSERLGNLSPLNTAFDPVLSVILGSLDAAAVFMRTKALRALGQILTSDPLVLKKANVRSAIEEHLLDNSPAVRDAAVELIGKYVIQLLEVAGDYYEKIADRILDTGLGVRKRVIKLLKVFYLSTDDLPRRVDISSRLAHRMLDEDDGVKDLAVKALEEIWFENEPPSNAPRDEDEQPRNMPTVLVILGVVSQKDRQANVSDFLHRIVTEKSEKEAQILQDQYARICDTLIDTLVDGRAATGFSVLSCVKAVQIFVDAKPSIISSTKAASLLPYLKNASTIEEQNIADNLLRIFRACIPSMTKAALKFGQELQASLQLMIVKPSSAGGLQTMQEAIACFCVVVNHLTHDYTRAIGLLKSCLSRLNDSAKKLHGNPDNTTLSRQMQLLVCMVALLGEHCNMDKIRQDHQDLAGDIDSITKNSVNEHIYKTMVKLYTNLPDPTLRNRVLQCLGFLFRAYPTLMTHESSSQLMDQIFSSEDEEAKARLLKILQDFLSSESAKHSAQEKAASANKKASKGVDMEAFVGNTHGFAESGVSSAIVQRYLPEILEAALVNSPLIQNAAVDILGFTIKQGLAHPLQCLPVIIALETTDNQQLSGRASALHTILHMKHASLIHSRYLECAQVAFRYQQKSSEGEVIQGFRTSTTTTAVLHKWYSLVKEKRQTRLDFIRTITKAFDVDSTKLSATHDEVQFVRFVVENLSAFDYKTQEEVLAVIRAVTNVLSVSGMQMMEILAPSDLMRQLDSVPASQDQPMAQPLEDATRSAYARSFEPFSMARASIILAMLLLLKSHLKTAYGLSEDKCAKWVPGKKSAVGDKAAVRKVDRPLYWEDRLPFAIAPLQSPEDVTQQQERFVQLWEADPVIAEPEDEMVLDA